MHLSLSTLLPPSSSPLPLRIIHTLQLTLTLLCAITILFCLIHPYYRQPFIFALLSSWILSSVLTTVMLHLERRAAAKGTLDKEKYFELQMFKVVGAGFFYIIGFLLVMGTKFESAWGWAWWVEYRHGGLRQLRVFVWEHYVNWLLLAVGMLYSCLMPRKYFEGRIRLGDEDLVTLGGDAAVEADAEAETESDEALARALQAEEPGWEA
ncbi:hypothetical protein BCR34DRAFT_362295 [Clohesyomyces aquaticus]|uniref:Uncharacterized protein n=1 Tax=Clohesyomyces aquaticus TaxID=1231657 RepID=A0A1Y2A720_9PLEO|nr:hypothetical protein BCR34DRAFT_362295 [Clohesyomyces aquaticus]